MKAILLNGPPRSGKDTAAGVLKYLLAGKELTYLHEKMSYPNKAAFAGMMNVKLDEDFNCEIYEAVKDEIIPELGVSYRQWQIDFSESFMKPKYGKAIFGQLLLGRIDRYKNGHRSATMKHELVVVVSDCGFQVEVDTLLNSKAFSDALLIRCHREGYDFSNDSRNYVHIRDGKHFEFNLWNNTTADVWRGLIIESVEKWLSVV